MFPWIGFAQLKKKKRKKAQDEEDEEFKPSESGSDRDDSEMMDESPEMFQNPKQQIFDRTRSDSAEF